MGEFSKIEIKILDRLTEVIDGRLESISYDNSEKDRMLYSTCINDDEKDKLTKREIKKLQKKISKCNSNVAGYISAFLNKYELEQHEGDFYSYRERICRNFISNYYEGIELLAEEYLTAEKVEQEDEMYFEAVLNDELYSFDKNEIEDFIKYMALAERLSKFKSILESVEEEKKKPKLDAIIDKMKAEVKERDSKKINDELSATLDNLRGQLISNLQLYNLIKNITNLEKDALEYLKEDIGWYLWSMKTAQECFYSKEETDRAYKKIEEKHTKEKQLELGYLRKTKTFFDVEYEDPEEPIYIDKEKLLFPNEFTSIKELITIIDKELNKLESISVENKTKNVKPDMYNQYKNDKNEEVLLVEELEKRLAIESVEYKKNCDDLWETYTFDPKYFDTYISGDLYNVFLKSIYEKIKPLNDFEINKYLTLSVNQFKTHIPEKRAEAFKRIYHDTYWHPNQMEYKANEYDNKYAMHVWKHYTNHFQIFKEATENVLQDFKKGLIGNSKSHQINDMQSVPKKTTLNALPQTGHINHSTKDIVEKIEAINKFEFLLVLDDDKFEIKKSSDEIQLQYFNYTEIINSYIKEIYLDGNVGFLKRLLKIINEYIVNWENIKKDDDYYLNIKIENEKYRHLTDNIEVNYITDTKLHYLNEIKQNLIKQINNNGKEKVIQKNLKDLVSEEKFVYILKLLEDLSVTIKGESTLTPRKKGALRGVVEALRDKMIIPNIGIASLCNMVAEQIGLELKSELDASTTSENYKKQTLEYIKNNPLH
ncbi:hypothetical protein [Bizionia sp. M204]|uniref:hypothetical protein n=1 Tax=Bizionia sp. M204 TaxID=2675331 RepID=UPI0020603B86|nr:hypothetical protein [Bizionia sp. M204]UPS90877.1 hypothetical protein GMA17_03720 [Bizionia sp. M204]